MEKYKLRHMFFSHLLQTCGLRVTAVDKNGVYWWFFFDLSVYG